MAGPVQGAPRGGKTNMRGVLTGGLLALIGVIVCVVLPSPVRARVQPVDAQSFSTQGMRRLDPADTQHGRWLGLDLVRYRFVARHVYAGDSGEDDAQLSVRSWLVPGLLHTSVFIEGMCGSASSGCWRPPGGAVSHQFQGRPTNLRVWGAGGNRLRSRLLPWSPKDAYSRPYGYAISVGWRWDLWLVAWAATLAVVALAVRRVARALRGS